ncbi:hypothetical protein BJ944DRAFT_236096 [Cunninghamella echinulata]|nr:hypothetical protein BJ944DRAFT_236096 [Cunninghamella echinulata]
MNHTKEKVKPPKSLRTARLSVVKNKISTPVSLPTHNASLATPKKVIKALYDYQAQSPRELSFRRGDFFHVTGNENDQRWYEACNPVSNSRGIVPVSYFQVLEKNERQLDTLPPPLPSSTSSSSSSSINITSKSPSFPSSLNHQQQQLQQSQPQQQQYHHQEQKQDSGFIEDIQGMNKKMQPLYGIVLYDFQAERSDELDAKAGEPIIVIAQSNLEWFVAKPIGRLGGPGLIPVSFVEIRDAVTGRTINNVGDLMQTSAAPIPKVEEWKKMTQGYEATSIPLGEKININGLTTSVSSSSSSLSSSGQQQQRQQQSYQQQQQSHHYSGEDYYDSTNPQQHLSQSSIMDNNNNDRRSHSSTKEPMVISANMDSFILEGDQFWFIVYARLDNGKHRILYRLYEDFYDFQINLLHEFPVEAGKEDRERILPYMPGPLTQVDEEVTAERQADLDKYCHELLALPPYLSQCSLVQNQLFGIHEGDVETEKDPRVNSNNNSHHNNIIQNNNNMHHHQQHVPISNTTLTHLINEESQTMTAQNTQNSTLTPGTIKVKIIHKDDIIAIKVPLNSTLTTLQSKINDRLGHDVSLQYKAEASKDRLPLETELDMEEAFAMAIKLGKLTVYAE